MCLRTSGVPGTARNRRAIVDDLGPAGSDPAGVFAAVVQHLAHRQASRSRASRRRATSSTRAVAGDLSGCARGSHRARPAGRDGFPEDALARRRLCDGRQGGCPVTKSLRVWINYHPYTVARFWARATGVALGLERIRVSRWFGSRTWCASPRPLFGCFCARLGIDYDEQMLDVGQINSSHQSSVGGAPGAACRRHRQVAGRAVTGGNRHHRTDVRTVDGTVGL